MVVGDVFSHEEVMEKESHSLEFKWLDFGEEDERTVTGSFG